LLPLRLRERKDHLRARRELVRFLERRGGDRILPCFVRATSGFEIGLRLLDVVRPRSERRGGGKNRKQRDHRSHCATSPSGSERKRCTRAPSPKIRSDNPSRSTSSASNDNDCRGVISRSITGSPSSIEVGEAIDAIHTDAVPPSAPAPRIASSRFGSS